MYSTKHMEDLQISYISALCASVGIDYDIQGHDADSTDAIIKKKIILPNGSWYFSQLRIQSKSTFGESQYEDKGDQIKYKLKVKNYNDLCTQATAPIILGLFILPKEDSTWVNWSIDELLVKGTMYWMDFSSNTPSSNSETITVTIPKSNVVSPDTLLEILTKIAKEEWP